MGTQMGALHCTSVTVAPPRRVRFFLAERRCFVLYVRFLIRLVRLWWCFFIVTECCVYYNITFYSIWKRLFSLLTRLAAFGHFVRSLGVFHGILEFVVFVCLLLLLVVRSNEFWPSVHRSRLFIYLHNKIYPSFLNTWNEFPIQILAYLFPYLVLFALFVHVLHQYNIG